MREWQEGGCMERTLIIYYTQNRMSRVFQKFFWHKNPPMQKSTAPRKSIIDKAQRDSG